MTEYKKKLIEVALPLDKINEASAREKSIRHGHPSTLHLWWARRPLASARAVIWSSLVDDPSAHPEQFPTEAEQERERKRLFDILEELVVWENSNDKRVLDAAKAEIVKSMGPEPIDFLDPFAGGGALPLEAQRLGLVAHAQDLNPVAVTINKAMIQTPPLFNGRVAVNPASRKKASISDWSGNRGLAADVEYYGNWMRDEAYRRIGNLYPKVQIPQEQGGGEATVIAWIWARTVTCPNPACGGEVPLAKSFDLSKKKGKEAHVEMECEGGKLRFSVASGLAKREGTVNRKGAVCPHCGQPVGFEHIREQSRTVGMGARLMAVVAEAKKGRLYISPDEDQIKAADVEKPEDYPTGELANYPGHLNTKIYGLDEFDKLFTNRQLTALTTFSDLVAEAQEKVREDAIAAGMPDDGVGLAQDGTGATAYGQAVGVYLAFLVDQMTNQMSSICGWNNTNTQMRVVFSRQAIPMTWDFAEANPFSSSSGSFHNLFDLMIKAFENLAPCGKLGNARQFDAQSDNGLRNLVISTDPPYYDNIGYADLSDYFYIWLRRSLRRTYPQLFSTALVPKTEELIATPYRDDRGPDGAKKFFEDGMSKALKRLYIEARDDVPTTVYYAFKQSDTEVDESGSSDMASSGWETMLAAVVNAGFAITGTWPMRTEKPGRTIGNGTNALASSIVLVCRKRGDDAPVCTRREFTNELRRELPGALKALQASNIAPVDLAQSAIGPGMGVFSRYAQVLDPDGTPMTVRAALQTINRELDAFMGEQDGDIDRESRFCVALYEQFGMDTLPFGVANTLATAKNVSVEALADKGLVFAERGDVHLTERAELDPQKAGACVWACALCLAAAMEQGGVSKTAGLAHAMGLGLAEQAKALAYRLFSVADRKGWTQEAYAYNALVTSWQDVLAQAASATESTVSGQLGLTFEE